MQVVQIVKRFGQVGGMEEYVFQLSIELSKLGIEVIVLCEKSFFEDSSEIKVVELCESSKPGGFLIINFLKRSASG